MPRPPRPFFSSVAAVCVAVASAMTSASPAAQDAVATQPTATLSSAAPLALPAAVDSNTPALWSLHDGAWMLSAFISWGGQPTVTTGAALDALPTPEPVVIHDHPGHGIWLEAVVEDDAGVWYGYYHHEVPAAACGRPDRQIPSIGALRSEDRGRTWLHLGIVLEAPADSLACTSTNRFVFGGVGDVTAVLDHDRQNLFLYFAQYAADVNAQGVAAARMAWADRDAPVGKMSVWRDEVWMPAREKAAENELTQPVWEYPTGTVLVPATKSWHTGGASADAYWGPSIHWNTYLEQWVMLVNRARDETFNQDGIYISFSPTLSDPRAWSPPRELLNGGGWYPQIIGLEPGTGSDKHAGRLARFFVTGRSQHLIEFSR